MFKTKLFSFLLSSIVITSNLIFSSTVVNAADINVNNVTVGKTGCVYSSIQEAINKVPNCAVTLIINPGTYYEHLTSIGKNISLQGTNKDTCII